VPLTFETRLEEAHEQPRRSVKPRHGRGRGQPELCGILGDGENQAANLISDATSIPSLNLTPLMTFGN
jgi:hypothetical protein